MAEYQAAHGPLRQSVLRSFDACPLAAKWEAEAPDYTTDVQALGIALHLVAEEILRTLHRQGERQMSQQESLEVMYEQVARPECPHLTDEQLHDLRILTIQFSHYEWTADKIVGIERRLFAKVPCPDGQTRTITTAPDVLIHDRPAHVTSVDFKSGWASPPTPRDGDWSKDGGRPYLSERGLFQLDCHGFCIMSTFHSVNEVTLRETHIRIDEVREATLLRDELEHVERRLGVLAQRLDMVLAGDLEAEPRAGRHCAYCPKPQSCPIPREFRADGKIESPEQAQAVAEALAPLEGVREQGRKALKAWLATHGPAIVFDNGHYGWKPTKTGRAFGLHSGPPQNGDGE